MPRRAAPSTHLLARIRAWFGLTQAELALYLGVSPELVNAVEAGRRALTSALLAALLPLTSQLPAAAGPEEASDAAGENPSQLPPDAAELDFRRRVCQQQAARIGQELAALATQARVARHWAQALPVLQQAVAAPSVPTAEAAERAAWLRDWLGRRARPLPPTVATRQRLLQARLAGLQAELAALAGE
ncbi:hypothetical protein GCM10023185_20940 [Hymenobacter saemangeumensis]|uniref:HTH cro/C1-type domain-containing protein n=1 Tax=Hymenobacter saemangeumensis TaxID=1084522 RepID=A0ABP8IE88_9BACT